MSDFEIAAVVCLLIGFTLLSIALYFYYVRSKSGEETSYLQLPVLEDI